MGRGRRGGRVGGEEKRREGRGQRRLDGGQKRRAAAVQEGGDGGARKNGEKRKKSGMSWVLSILTHDIVPNAHQLSIVVLGTRGAYQVCTQSPPPSGHSAAVLGPRTVPKHEKQGEKRGKVG